jgi:hypothetical protein
MASNPAGTVPDLSREHSCRLLIKQPIQDRGSHVSISPVRRDVHAFYLYDPGPDRMSGVLTSGRILEVSLRERPQGGGLPFERVPCI